MALYNLGLIHDGNKLFHRARAFHYYQLAADKGLDKAQFNLAAMYYNG